MGFRVYGLGFGVGGVASCSPADMCRYVSALLLLLLLLFSRVYCVGSDGLLGFRV